MPAVTELVRQIDLYVELGYPALAGLTEPEFRQVFQPMLGSVADAVGAGLDMTTSERRVPFVVVVTEALIPAAVRQGLTRLAGGAKPGVVDRNHGEGGVEPYRPIASLNVPDAPVYLLEDVERGEEFTGVPPQDALPVLLDRSRTPLTIDEGISLVTLFPAVLEKNKCFMLAGSRMDNKRVPAMWISDKAPKLGWCWDGNPHDWLGMASAGARRA
ncbi:MAG: hypothetical protein CVT64_10300 [Actinobacteria bacterium HGW-Actinobacteria-4]|nr:MAG: hypothetical protein CVT64_10300 [Actinobacteria bacterium HGW-Actinobacteria-4]